MKLTRRSFVAASSLAALQPGQAAPLGFLTPQEATLLEALCEQIIPADDVAGAKEAGVVNYIDLQLRGPLKRFAKYYRAGLAALAGTDFGSLPAAGQIAFLKRMEAGEIHAPEWKLQSAASFFNMVIDHTMQGFYGDPKHGGNKDAVSWKMLGIGEHKHA